MRQGADQMNRRLRQAVADQGVLVAAHRGTCGGHIIENTVDAFACALLSRADIMELDIIRSTDGAHFVFHDGNEPRLLGLDANIKTLTEAEILAPVYRNQTGHESSVRVNRLEDVLEFLRGKCLINADRCWDIWDTVIPLVKRHGMLDHVIFKSDPEARYFDFMERCPDPVMYMPKAFCAADIDRALTLDANVVAIESIFIDLESDLLDDENRRRWHDAGLLLWTNAMRLHETWNRNAWHDDNNAILGDMDANWGWLVDKGFDIIQTDWPLLLKTYLDTRKA